MRVAIVQFISSMEKAQNLQKALDYIAKAKQSGADFVIFPEIFMALTPPSSKQRPIDVAEPIDGPFVTALANAAKANSIYVVGGVYETIPDDPKHVYNTAVLLSPEGKRLKNYHKTHLFDAFAFKESDTTLPANNPYPVIETEFGNIGLLLCYELRFPEISRKLALQGADILILPAAWAAGLLKEGHWETLIRARAIENTVYVCACGQTGNDFSGRSMVVDPMGVVIASAGETETLFIADIDLNRVREVREKLPSLANRRPELYG